MRRLWAMTKVWPSLCKVLSIVETKRLDQYQSPWVSLWPQHRVIPRSNQIPMFPAFCHCLQALPGCECWKTRSLLKMRKLSRYLNAKKWMQNGARLRSVQNARLIVLVSWKRQVRSKTAAKRGWLTGSTVKTIVGSNSFRQRQSVGSLLEPLVPCDNWRMEKGIDTGKPELCIYIYICSGNSKQRRHV